MTMTWSTTVSRMVWRASSDPLITWAVHVGGGGAGGTFDGVHNDLTGRGTAGAHPASAVTADPTDHDHLTGSTTQAQLNEADAALAARPVLHSFDIGGAVAVDLPGYVISVNSDNSTVLAPLYEGLRVLAVQYLGSGFVQDVTKTGTIYTVGAAPGLELTATGEQVQVGELAVASGVYDPGSDTTLQGAFQQGARGALLFRQEEPLGIEAVNVGNLTRRIASTSYIVTLNGASSPFDLGNDAPWPGLVMCDPASGTVVANLALLDYHPGQEITFVRTSAGAVTINAQSGETIVDLAGSSVSSYSMTERYLRMRNVSGDHWRIIETSAAAGVEYDNSTSGLDAEEVQSAIDELAASGGGTVDVVSNVAQDRILGRTSSGSGDSEELTAPAVRALLGVQPADRLPITTRSSTRYGSGYLTTQGAGSPLVPYEASTAPTAVAVAAGTLYFWPFSGLKAATLAQLIIELTATALTAGQAVTVGMWADAADGGPGTSLWSEAITTGASTGIFYKTGLAQSRPTSGWIGFLNPSGNAGSCTVRMAAPQGDRLFLLGSSVGQRPALFTTGQSSWPSDMSSSAIWNTSPLTFSGAAPIILAGA